MAANNPSAHGYTPPRSGAASRVRLSDVRNGLVRIAVAYTGDFERHGKKFSITVKDLADMAQNLGQREVPIDYEHLSAGAAPPGWSKAAGWIRKADALTPFFSIATGDRGARGDGDRKILWAWAEFSPACLAAIKQKEYRYFSPEIHWNSVDEHGNNAGTRLAAGAVTNRPFLKDLPAIEISDASYQELFGLAARQDGRLAAIALSESGRLIDLDSIHVPKALDQVSVGYPQPAALDSRKQRQGGQVTGTRSSQAENRKEKSMANKFSLRKITLGPYEGKFGLYKDDDLMMDGGEPVLLDESDLPIRQAGDGDAEGRSAMSESALPAAGEPSAREIAVLSEIFKEGRVDPRAAAELADTRQVRLRAIFRAQAAERLVDDLIGKGKVLPKKRATAFRMALRDEAGLVALLADVRPAVDFKSHGHSAGGDGAGSAQEELDELVQQAMREKKTDYAAALTEVTRQHPDLWRRASQEVTVSPVPREMEEE